jgi:hypothetical protein
VRVQRVVSPNDGTESWTVLADDWAPVEPVELFLAHLSDQGVALALPRALVCRHRVARSGRAPVAGRLSRSKEQR